MTEKIILSKELLIDRGGERDCFNHPLDSKKVIKILHKKDEIHRNQNELEYRYLSFLEANKVPFTHISKCFGYVDTNLGQGLVFNKICNYSGEISISFRNMIMQGLLDYKTQDILIKEFKEYLFKNNILFVDCGLHNILVQEYEKNSYKLVIIDGLGGRRIGWKFYLYLKSKMFTKYKIMKQWQKFLENVKIKRKQYLNNG